MKISTFFFFVAVKFACPILMYVYFIADSGDESGLFPVAALFTGALLTIGLAVLLIVFIALRKNREQVQTHENGIKEKHIGECGN